LPQDQGWHELGLVDIHTFFVVCCNIINIIAIAPQAMLVQQQFKNILKIRIIID
jgi:hypothetical protein